MSFTQDNVSCNGRSSDAAEVVLLFINSNISI